MTRLHLVRIAQAQSSGKKEFVFFFAHVFFVWGLTDLLPLFLITAAVGLPTIVAIRWIFGSL